MVRERKPRGREPGSPLRERLERQRERPSRRVEQVLSMIRRLTVAELVELVRKLNADPRWPGAEGAPVGAKPKSGPPTLSASAEAGIPRE